VQVVSVFQSPISGFGPPPALRVPAFGDAFGRPMRTKKGAAWRSDRGSPATRRAWRSARTSFGPPKARPRASDWLPTLGARSSAAQAGPSGPTPNTPIRYHRSCQIPRNDGRKGPVRCSTSPGQPLVHQGFQVVRASPQVGESKRRYTDGWRKLGRKTLTGPPGAQPRAEGGHLQIPHRPCASHFPYHERRTTGKGDRRADQAPLPARSESAFAPAGSHGWGFARPQPADHTAATRIVPLIEAWRLGMLPAL